MPSLNDSSVRRELVRRARLLEPDTIALWGRMTCPQMLAHANDMLRMCVGDITTEFQKLPFRFPVVKHLAIYWLPWGKGIPSAPELFRTTDLDWNEEQRVLPELLERVARRDPAVPLPLHPFFGKISPRAWAVLGYRHTDHHLRQFGV
jgi:hypothetical protein